MKYKIWILIEKLLHVFHFLFCGYRRNKDRIWSIAFWKKCWKCYEKCWKVFVHILWNAVSNWENVQTNMYNIIKRTLVSTFFFYLAFEIRKTCVYFEILKIFWKHGCVRVWRGDASAKMVKNLNLPAIIERLVVTVLKQVKQCIWCEKMY